MHLGSACSSDVGTDDVQIITQDDKTKIPFNYGDS